MNSQVEYIVVGQGLAGTLVCHMLEERGRKFVVFDQGHHHSSSYVAAGIINPVTGRRFVKSWMYEKLLPVALNCYRRIEEKLNVSILRQRNILRYLPDSKSENEWLSRSEKPGYDPYILEKGQIEQTSVLDLKGRWGEVTSSYQVDIRTLITRYQQHLREKSVFRSQKFDTLKLLEKQTTGRIHAINFDKIIFCEGHLLSTNRLFASDFLNASKGEALILKIPGYHPEKNLKKKFFLVPWIDDCFWFGAMNGWHFNDPFPTDLGHEVLLAQARKLIKSDFHVISHVSAIRPTIKDRRPVLGRHPLHENMYLFNGLGTKGASLAPFWAEKLLNLIENNEPLDQQVDLNRF